MPREGSVLDWFFAAFHCGKRTAETNEWPLQWRARWKLVLCWPTWPLASYSYILSWAAHFVLSSARVSSRLCLVWSRSRLICRGLQLYFTMMSLNQDISIERQLVTVCHIRMKLFNYANMLAKVWALRRLIIDNHSEDVSAWRKKKLSSSGPLPHTLGNAHKFWYPEVGMYVMKQVVMSQLHFHPQALFSKVVTSCVRL